MAVKVGGKGGQLRTAKEITARETPARTRTGGEPSPEARTLWDPVGGHNHDGNHGGRQVQHSHLAGIGPNDHHNQVHAINGPDHTLAGATAGHVMVAQSANTFGFEAPGTRLVMVGTHAARPAPAVAGRLYYSSDHLGGCLFRDNGVSWKQIAVAPDDLTAYAAPRNAAYLVTSPSAGLDSEVELAQVVRYGILADRPAGAISGELYFATDVDGGTLYRGNGAGWNKIADGLTENAPAGNSYVLMGAGTEVPNHAVLGTSVVMRGTAAARPAASVAGRLYFATDTDGGTLYRDTGSAWEKIADGLTENAPAGNSYVLMGAGTGVPSASVLGASVVMAGTLAARPVASVAGRLYLATDLDGGTLYRDTGAAWVKAACAAGTPGRSSLLGWCRNSIGAAGVGWSEMPFQGSAGTFTTGGIVMPRAGYLSDISVALGGDVGGAGVDYRVDIYRNGVSTGIIAIVTGGAGTEKTAYASGAVSFSAGDLITVYDVRVGAVAAVPCMVTIFFVLT